MKTKVKLITLILSALLIISSISILASCDNINYQSDPDPDPDQTNTNPDNIDDKTGKLTDKIKSEIQLKYYDKHTNESDSPAEIKGVCYGVFDDTYCLILTLPGVGYMTVTTEIDVAKYTFYFGDSNTMIVYDNGEFYSLTKAYENGILNDAEIEELYYFYNLTKYDGRNPHAQNKNDINWYFSRNEEQIKNDYFEKTYQESTKEYYNSPDQVKITCYGVFDHEYYCIKVHIPPYAYDESYHEYTIGKWTFVASNSGDWIKVYANGEFYSLSEAYDMDLLNNTDIEALHDYIYGEN